MIKPLLICLLCLSDLALAEVLPDPTRPPESFINSSAGVVLAPPLVQSVFISPTHRSATIAGEVVMLGGSFRGAKLVSITENEIWLKTGESVQVLKVVPAVEKNVIKTVKTPTPVKESPQRKVRER